MRIWNLMTPRVFILLTAAALMSTAIFLLLGGISHAQDGASITPSFGNGKLKLLGEGFKANENVTITVKLDSGTHTFTVTANAQGEFELVTGLDLAPGSSVELDARGDQSSGGASITSVPPNLPLPQTGAAVSSFGTVLFVGLLLLAGGIFLVARRRVA
ncbi:LPXTG cell wall anchor domain-containing protein [Anaerolineae bacterium CFX7]|nr:LPXTG cell wall anchor domain-containing protein [Anaerolineae bacterium CFX7]